MSKQFHRVFVIQDSPGKNLSPAKEYGELVVMLTGKESIEEAEDKLNRYLSDFGDCDYLLLIGNPIFIAMASITASIANESVNFLIWEREHYKYRVEKILC